MNAATQFLLKMGPMRLFAAMGITALAAAALFALIFQVGSEPKALLFSDVSLEEAGQITAKLETAKIDYELTGGGSTIMVPRSKVMEARMLVSEDGLLSRGSVGYEIFDRQDALGATQFQQNINRLRALEGELARTIVSLDGVEKARVHLVMPERQLFERTAQQPSASIVLTLNGDIGGGQVRAVRNLVASAVPGLSPQRVTVLDNSGRMLAAGDSESDSAAVESGDARQAGVEERIRKTVQDILDGVVGPGASRVQVSAEMDFNRIEQESVTYDPEGRVLRSSQSVEESSNASDAEEGSAASSSRNVPDGANAAGGAGSNEASNRTEETQNFEISSTRKKEIIEGGRVRRLSVSVAVDGVTTPAAEGQEAQWAPRDAAEMERITALVRAAVGFDEARGDRVEVVNVRLTKPEAAGAEAAEPGLFDFQRSDVMRGVEILAALIASLALVFFVLRPLISGLVRPAAAVAGQAAIAGGGAAGTAIAGGVGGDLAALPPPEPSAISADLQRFKGEVKASSIKQVAEIVEQHPEESAAILRGWLSNAM